MDKLALTIEGFGQGGTTTIANPTPQFSNVGDLISRGLEVGFIIAGFLLVFWLVWGIFQYLFAGGNKDSLTKAKGRITWAIVGFIIIIISFFVSGFFKDILKPSGGLTSVFETNKGGGDIGTCEHGQPPRYADGSVVQPGAICISRATFPYQFEIDCKSTDCVNPSTYIPYIYHQYDVKLNRQGEFGSPIDEYVTYNCTEEQMVTATNPGGAACGPTSMAMAVEAVNPIVGAGHQTANDLTRLFLNRKIMSCADGTDLASLESYVNKINYQNEGREFHIDVRGIVSTPNFQNLINYYNENRTPVMTNVYFAGGSAGHYVVIAGISDRYVWVADPMSPGPEPDQQYYLRYERDYFASNYYKGRYLDLYLGDR